MKTYNLILKKTNAPYRLLANTNSLEEFTNVIYAVYWTAEDQEWMNLQVRIYRPGPNGMISQRCGVEIFVEALYWYGVYHFGGDYGYPIMSRIAGIYQPPAFGQYKDDMAPAANAIYKLLVELA